MYSKKGFSLIELIVVISIITIFFGISVAVYKNSLDEKRLTIDIKLLESIIQDTKQRARARDISPMTTCSVFESYNLVINPVANTVSQQFLCDGNTVTVQNYVFEKTTLIQPASVKTLQFISSTGEHINPELTIVLKNTFTNMCVSVLVPKISSVVVGDPYIC